MGAVIRVENIGKQYRLGEVGTGTLSHDLNRLWARLRGKDDPFLKIGDSNDRTQKGGSDYVWALKDINFDVQQGDAVGIIGRNGAGKSTLLKLLSRTTLPTTGSIKVKGRITSLLEVGTGFMPEMTGRENIYQNGALLGMRKAEITRKLDEIIDFSGCERYIDTPVKRYSSGMYVRLAFAVAAHLEAEILVVDEVLAVGDAEFQKKCLGKMNDISKGEGRTVLFVSHNMGSVKSLCNKGILIENGVITFKGSIEKSIDSYNKQSVELTHSKTWEINKAPGNFNAKILSVNISTEDNFYTIEKDFFVEVGFVNFIENSMLNISLSIHDENETYVLSSPNLERVPLTAGLYTSRCKIPKNLLNKGKYFFTILLVGNNYEIIAQLDRVTGIELGEDGLYRAGYHGTWSGVVRPYLDWETFKN